MARAPKVKKKRTSKKKTTEAKGLTASAVAAAKDAPTAVAKLAAQVEADGGQVLGTYREPLGGHWQLLVALPLDQVKPTSFQRDLSETHAKRLAEKIERVGRFLDPITVVRAGDRDYLTPNGYHRTSAMQRIGAQSIVALLIPDPKLAHQILALNTEKAYNVKEKSLEAIRLLREIERTQPAAKESDFSAEFEEAPFLTLGACYEKKGNFSGGAYQPVLRRCDLFFDEKVGKAMASRGEQADRLLALDAKVAAAVEALKAKGLKSPYLKAFVVARINPLRWVKDAGEADFDETMGKMEAAIKKFDAGKIEQRHLAGMGGAPASEE